MTPEQEAGAPMNDQLAEYGWIVQTVSRNIAVKIRGKLNMPGERFLRTPGGPLPVAIPFGTTSETLDDKGPLKGLICFAGQAATESCTEAATSSVTNFSTEIPLTKL